MVLSKDAVILSEASRSPIARGAVEGPAVTLLQPQQNRGAPSLTQPHRVKGGITDLHFPSSKKNAVILSEASRSPIARGAVEGPAVTLFRPQQNI